MSSANLRSTRQRSERRSRAAALTACIEERLSWLGLSEGDDGLAAVALKKRITTREIGEILRALLTCGCRLELTSSSPPKLFILKRKFKLGSLNITAGIRICGEKFCLDVLIGEAQKGKMTPVILRIVPASTSSRQHRV